MRIMKLVVVDKKDVLSMLGDDNLYMVKVSYKTHCIDRYLSSRLVSSLNVKEVMSALSDSTIGFMKVETEEGDDTRIRIKRD